VQLFDAHGEFRAALPDTGFDTGAPHAPEFTSDRAPWARFVAQGSLESVYGIAVEADAVPTRLPLLEIAVPLATRAGAAPLGSARYWLDGRAIAAELARLDRGLWQQAGLALAGAALLVGMLLWWSFRRLHAAHEELVAQSADLARANAELDFAAKTAAVGAISAHLIHGLKNPLAGLEGFVAETAASGEGGGEAWQTALKTARRLRATVGEVVSVLADETNGSADYPVPLGDLMPAIAARVRPAAEAADIELIVDAAPNAAVAARVGNLASLVIANLVANAIDVSHSGQRVRLTCVAVEHLPERRIEFTIADEGPGLPPSVRATLFRPTASTKRGGGGIGLAISHRLARHAGGTLELLRSDAAGTVFRLRVPAAA
jgi:signal transduction histidine kinase